MCFSCPDSRDWHHVNNRERNTSFLPPILSFSSLSSLPAAVFVFSVDLSFSAFFCFYSDLPVPPSALSFCLRSSLLFLFLWGDRESCNHREVVCKGSGWAQLCTTVWWSLLPICICKSLRILFVCLLEPGQVCWMPAKAKIKTSNPISYYT